METIKYAICKRRRVVDNGAVHETEEYMQTNGAYTPVQPNMKNAFLVDKFTAEQLVAQMRVVDDIDAFARPVRVWEGQIE